MNKQKYIIYLIFLNLFIIFLCPLTGVKAEEKAPGPEKATRIAGNYIIGKGDALEVHVWKEPDLSRAAPVRIDGMMSLPLVGDVRAAGRTPMDLQSVLEERLSEYIAAPAVTVMIRLQGSKKYYMIGEIARTGEFDLNKDLTALQAIVRAGGFTEWADRDEILLLRRDQDGEKRIQIDYDAIVEGTNPEQNVLLQADDTIIVPQ